MEKQIETLNMILDEDFPYGEKEYLREYFELLDKYELSLIINDYNVLHKVMIEFEEKYNFNYHYATIYDDFKNILKQVIFSIKLNLEDSSNFLKLVPLIVYIDRKHTFINHLMKQEDIKNKFKDFSLSTLENFKLDVKPQEGVPNYNWEFELFENYIEGLEELNFCSIYDLVESIERGIGYFSNMFLNLSKFIISNNYSVEYKEVVSSRENVFEIRELLKDVSNKEKLRIALESNSNILKFEVIRELVYSIKENHCEEIIEEISELVFSFTSELSLWEKFIKYYLLFPSRSPQFFSALGLILNKIPDKYLECLVKIIKIDKYTSDDEVKALGNAFTNENLENQKISRVLNLLYIRWENYLENYKDYTGDIFATGVINIVIFYVQNIMDNKEWKEKHDKSIYNIREIENIWFKDELEQHNYFYKNLTLVFIYGYRLEIEERKEILEELKDNCYLKAEVYENIRYNWGNNF